MVNRHQIFDPAGELCLIDITELEVRLKNLKGPAVRQLFI